MRSVLKIATLIVIPTLFITSCKGNSGDIEKNYETITTKIRVDGTEQRAFGNFPFEVSDAQLKEKGYEYGDLINVSISNIPDKDGKPVKSTKLVCPLVMNYNEAGYNAPCLCNYLNKWDRPQLSWGVNPYMTNDYFDHFIANKDTIVVELSMYKKDGYKKTRELIECGSKQTFEELNKKIDDFANFRDVTSISNIRDKIKPGMLYRGSSPYNAESNESFDGRHIAADLCLKNEEVKNEVSLCYNKEKIEKYYNDRETDFSKITNKTFQHKPEYSKSLFSTFDLEGENKKFFTVDLGTDYYSETCLIKIGHLFNYIANTKVDESVYLHCNEGKDRTGFFVMLIEALCGCDFDSICSDFMATFKNYFNISKRDNEEKYKKMEEITVCRHIISIMIDDPFNNLCKTNWFDPNLDLKNKIEKEIKTKSLEEYAKNYIILTATKAGYNGEDIVNKLLTKFKIK